MSINAKTHKRIYNIFRRYGFSHDEATWAARNNLDPKGPKAHQIKRLLRNRRARVELVMREFGWDREYAISKLEAIRIREAIRQGADDIDNIFIGAY